MPSIDIRSPAGFIAAVRGHLSMHFAPNSGLAMTPTSRMEPKYEAKLQNTK